jgi:hypothetical protein
VRENAHNIPQCKKGPARKERFFTETRGILPEKWPKIPAREPNIRRIPALKMNQISLLQIA